MNPDMMKLVMNLRIPSDMQHAARHLILEKAKPIKALNVFLGVMCAQAMESMAKLTPTQVSSHHCHNARHAFRHAMVCSLLGFTPCLHSPTILYVLALFGTN